MAEQEQDQFASLRDEKKQLDDFFSRVNQAVPKLEQQLKDAESAGDSNLATRISGELLAIGKEADLLGDRYAEIDYQLTGGEAKLAEVQRASESLRGGGYAVRGEAEGIGGMAMGIPMPPVSLRGPLKREETEQSKKEALSVITNVPAEKINTDGRQMPASQRAALGALQSPEKRAQFVESKYGQGNVFPFEINGKTEFLVKKPDGTAFTTENKGFAGGAGVAIVEVPIVAAETAAGLGTLALTKSPSMAIVSSGATRATLGTAIDSGVESILGVAPDSSDFFSTATRRGTEGAVSIIAGGIIDKGTSKYLSGRISPKFTNEFAEELEKSASRLMAREEAAARAAGRTAGEISVPAGATIGGPRGLATQQLLAGERKGAGFVGSMRATQDTLRGLWDSFKTGAPMNPGMMRQVAQQQMQAREKLYQEIAKRSTLSAGAIRRNLEQKLGRFSQITANEDELGRVLQSALNAAEADQVAIKTATYDRFFDLADQAGFQVDPEELFSMSSNLVRDANKGGTFDNSAVNSVLKRLRRRADASELLSSAETKANILASKGKEIPSGLAKEIEDLKALQGPIDAREFDAWIRAFRDARPDTQVGAATKDQLGGEVATRMSSQRRDMYGQYTATLEDGSTANLGDFFKNAVDEYSKRMEFERNILGRVLKEEAGENRMFPREIVGAVMAEPAKIRKVLDAVRRYESQDPSRAGISDSITEMMQRQYFNSLGFGRPGVNPSAIKYDRGMMEELFGRSAPRVMRDFDDLNRTLSAQGLGKNITFDDIKLIGSTLDQNSKRQAIKQVSLRLQAERDLENLQNQEIFKLAQRGMFQGIDPDLLSKSILSDGTTITEVRQTMVQLSRLSPTARNAYKGDFIRELMNSFPGGQAPAGAPYTPMFDTQAFVKAMDAPLGKSSFRKKVESVLGKDDSTFLYDLAKVANANRIENVKTPENLRATAGMAGVSFYLAQGVGRNVRNRLMATMLSSPLAKKPAVARALAGGLGGGATDNAYRDLFKDVFTTRSGLMGLAHQAKDDEEFSMYLQNMAKQFKSDDDELSRAMGEE